MKGFLVSLSKFVLGVVIALLLLSMAGVATARYFMARLAILPPKPFYDSEQPAPAAAAPPEDMAAVAAEPGAEAATPPPEAAPEPELPPDSYKAIVVQPIGLIVREGPGTGYPQVGGVDHNEELVVLEEPDGQGWIRVQVITNGQEGWVRAGNTRRLD